MIHKSIFEPQTGVSRAFPRVFLFLESIPTGSGVCERPPAASSGSPPLQGGECNVPPCKGGRPLEAAGGRSHNAHSSSLEGNKFFRLNVPLFSFVQHGGLAYLLQNLL